MNTKNPHIAILLCTYNGEEFLLQQLLSYLDQSHKNWSLWVSDDGSNDNTIPILQKFKAEHPEKSIEILSGPRSGFCKNFMSLLCNESIAAEYYALSDQDDVWMPGKLETALEQINFASEAVVYGGRTALIDDNGDGIGLSPLFAKPPSFRNALVQSIMGGNTMVLNQKAMELIRDCGIVDVVSHDWWIYLAITGSGGKAIYDEIPQILYRQHSANIVGSNNGIRSKISRLERLFAKDFRGWNDRHISVLSTNINLLTAENQDVLNKFMVARKKIGFAPIAFIWREKIYRQTRFDQCALFIAGFFRIL